MYIHIYIYIYPPQDCFDHISSLKCQQIVSQHGSFSFWRGQFQILKAALSNLFLCLLDWAFYQNCFLPVHAPFLFPEILAIFLLTLHDLFVKCHSERNDLHIFLHTEVVKGNLICISTYLKPCFKEAASSFWINYSCSLWSHELWPGEPYQLIMGTLKDSEFPFCLNPQYFQMVIHCNHFLGTFAWFENLYFLFALLNPQVAFPVANRIFKKQGNKSLSQ